MSAGCRVVLHSSKHPEESLRPVMGSFFRMWGAQCPAFVGHLPVAMFPGRSQPPITASSSGSPRGGRREGSTTALWTRAPRVTWLLSGTCAFVCSLGLF